ncbi:hypothetical protein NKH18_46750 [Streptomyces sp. M10(2022)]
MTEECGRMSPEARSVNALAVSALPPPAPSRSARRMLAARRNRGCGLLAGTGCCRGEQQGRGGHRALSDALRHLYGSQFG